MIGGSLAGLLYDLIFARNASFSKVRQFFTKRLYDADETQHSEYQSFPVNNEGE